MVRRLRPGCEHGVHQLASAMEEATGVAAGARCRSGSSTSAIGIPARAASRRRPRSRTRPPAESTTPGPRRRRSAVRKAARQGRNRSARGSRLGQPSSRSRSPALPLGEDGNREAGLGGRQRPEVAVEIRVAHDDRTRRSLPLGERQRLALPATRRRRGRAPARSAVSAVPSVEPSSATITCAPGNCSRNRSTARAMRSASSRAATKDGDWLSHLLGRAARLDRRRHRPVVGRRLQPVVTSAPPARSSASASFPICVSTESTLETPFAL